MTASAIERWLAFMEDGDIARLDDLLDDAATFYSPAMFTPQVGREKTAAYLVAAEKMFARSDFHYTNHWYGDRSAVLEFSATVDDVHVDGIDMIHWNDAGRIVAFKVLVRPLKALQTVIPKMGELLSR